MADSQSFVPPVRDDLVHETPYGAPQVHATHLMNVNENPFGPSPALIQRIQQRVGEAAVGLNRYPDREFLTLRTRLGEYLAHDALAYGGAHMSAVPAAQIWVANGSNEIMQQVFQAFGGPGRRALGFAPHYSMYPEYARNTLTEWVVANRGPAPDFSLLEADVICAITEHNPTIVLLTSPNNPTGTPLFAHTVSEVARVLEARGAILVVDEAYAEFRHEGTVSAVSLLDEHPNLIVSRTMAKAFALAGARVGYMAASEQIVDAVRVVRLPYHLSAVTQAVAHAALDHTEELLAGVDFLRKARDELSATLTGLGYEVAPSDANFLLFGTFEDRHAIWQALLDRGVLIREVGPEGWLRVSVGTRENNKAFIDALTEVTRA